MAKNSLTEYHLCTIQDMKTWWLLMGSCTSDVYKFKILGYIWRWFVWYICVSFETCRPTEQLNLSNFPDIIFISCMILCNWLFHNARVEFSHDVSLAIAGGDLDLVLLVTWSWYWWWHGRGTIPAIELVGLPFGTCTHFTMHCII